jgi:hypothetical protein
MGRPEACFVRDGALKIFGQQVGEIAAQSEARENRWMTRSLRLAGMGYAGTCQPRTRKRSRHRIEKIANARRE